jgi:hypothetical protein
MGTCTLARSGSAFDDGIARRRAPKSAASHKRFVISLSVKSGRFVRSGQPAVVGGELLIGSGTGTEEVT